MKPVSFLALAFAAGLLFVFVPEIDFAAARLFFDPAQGGFYLRYWAPLAVVFRAVPLVIWCVVAGLALATLAHFVPVLARFRPRRAVIAYVALSLLIGPGLLTNGILKENWGRARPAQVTEFGGPATFTPAFVRSTACTRNCSFVSGHAAAGFFLVTFALLATPGTRRRAAVAGTVALGTMVGLARVAQGAHWLSDIVFAGVFNVGVAWALHAALIARPGIREACARALTRPTVRRHLMIFAAVTGFTLLSVAFLDRPLTQWIATRALPHDTWAALSRLGEPLGWILGSLVLFAVLRRLTRFAVAARMVLFIFATTATANIFAAVLKFLCGRPRPEAFLKDGTYDFHWLDLAGAHASFPSGHATTAFAAATALALIAPRGRALFLALALMVAATRVGAAQHYLADVVFGGWLGTVTAIWMRGVFARSGIALNDASPPPKAARWRDRLGFGDA